MFSNFVTRFIIKIIYIKKTRQFKWIKLERVVIVSALSKGAKKLGINLKNWYLRKHKYTGPFTDLDTRLDANGNPKLGWEQYNKIDEIAMHNDFFLKNLMKVRKLGVLVIKLC